MLNITKRFSDWVTQCFQGLVKRPRRIRRDHSSRGVESIVFLDGEIGRSGLRETSDLALRDGTFEIDLSLSTVELLWAPLSGVIATVLNRPQYVSRKEGRRTKLVGAATRPRIEIFGCGARDSGAVRADICSEHVVLGGGTSKGAGRCGRRTHKPL